MVHFVVGCLSWKVKMYLSALRQWFQYVVYEYHNTIWWESSVTVANIIGPTIIGISDYVVANLVTDHV